MARNAFEDVLWICRYFAHISLTHCVCVLIVIYCLELSVDVDLMVLRADWFQSSSPFNSLSLYLFNCCKVFLSHITLLGVEREKRESWVYLWNFVSKELHRKWKLSSNIFLIFFLELLPFEGHNWVVLIYFLQSDEAVWFWKVRTLHSISLINYAFVEAIKKSKRKLLLPPPQPPYVKISLFNLIIPMTHLQ